MSGLRARATAPSGGSTRRQGVCSNWRRTARRRRLRSAVGRRSWPMRPSTRSSRSTRRRGRSGFSPRSPAPRYSPLPVAAGPDGVWFADSLSGGSTGLVEKIDDILASGSPSAQIAIPGDEKTLVSSYFFFDGLAAGDGALWLAGDARERVVWRLDPEDAPGRRADPPAVHPEGDRGRRRCRLGDVAPRRHRLADRPTDEPHRRDDPGRPRPELDRRRQRRGLGDERDRRRALAHRPDKQPRRRADPARRGAAGRRGRRRRRLGDDHEAGPARADASDQDRRLRRLPGRMAASPTTTAWRARSSRSSSAAAGSVSNRPTG